jgi:ABC-type lipoprotein release transport system permease subunit
VVVCIECSVGFHLGAVIGWAIGWCIAIICKNYCELMHSACIDVLTMRYYLPHEYSRYGLIVGAILGTIIVLTVTLYKSTKTIERKEK